MEDAHDQQCSVFEPGAWAKQTSRGKVKRSDFGMLNSDDVGKNGNFSGGCHCRQFFLRGTQKSTQERDCEASRADVIAVPQRATEDAKGTDSGTQRY